MHGYVVVYELEIIDLSNLGVFFVVFGVVCLLVLFYGIVGLLFAMDSFRQDSSYLMMQREKVLLNTLERNLS